MPIVHPRFKREFFASPGKNRPGPYTRADLVLTSQGIYIICKTRELLM